MSEIQREIFNKRKFSTSIHESQAGPAGFGFTGHRTILTLVNRKKNFLDLRESLDILFRWVTTSETLEFSQFRGVHLAGGSRSRSRLGAIGDLLGFWRKFLTSQQFPPQLGRNQFLGYRIVKIFKI